MRTVRLAVIGAGPTCTYVMERLAATVPALRGRVALEIDIFDKGGQFGAGAVHSDAQPRTSFLNRIVGQVAFAADESVADAGPLLATDLRPTLYEWCRRKFRETGDPVFDVSKEDWPKRYVHGMALREVFGWYVDILREQPHVRVSLHDTEVVDVVDGGTELQVVGEAGVVTADHVLFLTGHSWNDPAKNRRLRPLVEFAANGGATFVGAAYPLEDTLGEDVAPAGSVVGCMGMGLTTIDVILWLTEGRGGTFEEVGGRLVYRPSGAEPASVVAFSEAGLFTFARPYNAKERDLAALEHRGAFLTEPAIDALRASVGTPGVVGRIGARRQLDFTRHVFPLVLLEMAHLHYTTLLGADFGEFLAARASTRFRAFLAGASDACDSADPGAHLLEPVEEAVAAAVALVDGVLRGVSTYAEACEAADGWSFEAAFRRYLDVVLGQPGRERVLSDPNAVARVAGERERPWGHALLLADNRFSWADTIAPIPAADLASPERYRDAVVEFMRRDHLWAAQDNLTNPAKAAADGVWRDLRPVLGHAVDFGGLTAASHREFLDVYMRHHNRLANGAALEVMEKILALVEHGVVDVSAGPRATVAGNPETGRYAVRGHVTGAERDVDVLVDAKVHAFDPELDTAPLYQRLLERGLVHKWRNPSATGDHFEPGGLDLTPDFHPVGPDDRVDRRLTFLGPPSEGVQFFQLGALRPNQDHHVMRDVLAWLREFFATSPSPDKAAVPAG